MEPVETSHVTYFDKERSKWIIRLARGEKSLQVALWNTISVIGAAQWLRCLTEKMFLQALERWYPINLVE